MLTFLKQNFRWIAGGFLLTFFSSFGQTFFVSASVGEWQAEFELSHGQFGRLYMLATLTSAICLPSLGRMVDWMPEHRTLYLVMPVLAAACLLAGYASSVIVLAVAIFLLRLFGQGMMTHIALTATGRWFDQHRGRAISLVVLGHQGGEATLPLVFASLSEGYGYQMGWVVGACALVLVGLPLGAWSYSKPRNHQAVSESEVPAEDRTRHWTRSEVVRDPVFWFLLVGLLAPPMIGTTIFYHQDYLSSVNGWSSRLYAISLTVMAITTVIAALVCGAAIDRYRASTLLPLLLLPLATTCFVLSVSGPTWSLFVVMVLLGISYGCSSTLIGSIWPEVYGTLHLGAIRSVVVSAMVFATAAGPGLTGTLIDSGIELSTQFAWAGVYCLVSCLIVATAAKKIRRRQVVDAESSLA